MLFLRPGLRASYATSAGKVVKDQMSWEKFFKLRQQRRRLGQLCSVGTTAAATAAAYNYFANLEIDMEKRIFGLEMIYVYGIGIVAAGFGGWLAGPSVGNALFRVYLGRNTADWLVKDRIFLKHVFRNRPDPRRTSQTNPVTDFYGEKIGSKHDYRRWLRESRLYKRKAEQFL